MQIRRIAISVQRIVYAEGKDLLKPGGQDRQQIHSNTGGSFLAVQGYRCRQVRTFWIKVKSIVKVSLDRLRILSLLNEKIFTRYEEIIALINNNYDQQKGIEDFISVENLLKKRNVDALIFGKGQFSNHNSQAKMTKNRSESTLKQSKFSPK